MSAVSTYLIGGVLASIALAAITVFWRGIRVRCPGDSDGPDVAWFQNLGEGIGEDTSVDRRIAAADASRRRVARVGHRRLP